MHLPRNLSFDGKNRPVECTHFAYHLGVITVDEARDLDGQHQLLVDCRVSCYLQQIMVTLDDKMFYFVQLQKLPKSSAIISSYRVDSVRTEVLGGVFRRGLRQHPEHGLALGQRLQQRLPPQRERPQQPARVQPAEEAPRTASPVFKVD